MPGGDVTEGVSCAELSLSETKAAEACLSLSLAGEEAGGSLIGCELDTSAGTESILSQKKQQQFK